VGAVVWWFWGWWVGSGRYFERMRVFHVDEGCPNYKAPSPPCECRIYIFSLSVKILYFSIKTLFLMTSLLFYLGVVGAGA
jgi:hypothetical protein